MDHRDKLLTIFDGYCAATGTSESRVSTIVLNGGHRALSIRNGGSFTVRTYERALRWFSAHWPADAAWPAEVERPEPTEEAA
jgi:hypothetical protein